MRTKEYRYYNDNGIGIPSVTELIGLLNKPYLIKWANSLGLKGEKYDDVSSMYTDIGTLTHKLNEIYITSNRSTLAVAEEYKRSTIHYDYKVVALNSFKNFKRWYDDNYENIKPLYNEYTVIGEKYAGTIDFICELNGQPTIIDFKTSREISVDYYIQLMAYYNLLKEKGIKITRVAILRQDKYKLDYEYLEYDIKKLKTLGYLNIFNSLLDIYYNYSKVEEIFKQDKKNSKES